MNRFGLKAAIREKLGLTFSADKLRSLINSSSIPYGSTLVSQNMAKYQQHFPELVDPALQVLVNRVAKLLRIEKIQPLETFIELLKIKLKDSYPSDELDTCLEALGIKREWNIWYLEYPSDRDKSQELLFSINNHINSRLGREKQLNLEEIYDLQNHRGPQFAEQVEKHFSRIRESLVKEHTEDRKLIRDLAGELEQEIEQLLANTNSITLEELLIASSKIWIKIVNPSHEVTGKRTFINQVISRLKTPWKNHLGESLSVNLNIEDFISEVTKTLSADKQNHIDTLSDGLYHDKLSVELANEFYTLLIELHKLPNAFRAHPQDIHQFHTVSHTRSIDFVSRDRGYSELVHSCPAKVPMQKLFHYIWQNFTYDEASQSLVKRAAPLEVHVTEQTTTET